MAVKEKVRVVMIGAGSMMNSVHFPSLVSFEDVVGAEKILAQALLKGQ